VRSDVLRAGKSLALPTLAVALAIAFLPGHAELAVRLYVFLLCGSALVLAVAWLRSAFPESAQLRPAAAAHRSGRRAPPGPLARIEQEVALGVAGSFDFHHRLRPRLRGLAKELLAARRGISLDDQPESARLVLGDETWELVRPDRPPPEDRLARGVPPADLLRVVESMERI
jgi:hypothetical protein